MTDGKTIDWFLLTTGTTVLFSYISNILIDRRKDKKAKLENTKRFCKILGVELKVVWTRYRTVIHDYMMDLDADKPFDVTVPIKQNYLAYYDMNIDKLITIESDLLRERIATLCINIKGLIDSHEGINDRIRFYESTSDQKTRQILRQNLISNGQTIKSLYLRIDTEIFHIIRELENYKC